MSKRNRHTEDIYSSSFIQALEQEYCTSCSAAVVSSGCVVSSHGLGARLVSRIYHGGRKAVYTATVGAMLANNLTPYAAAATVTVSAGEVSAGMVVSSGTQLDVYGKTSGTKVYSRGYENIFSGGSAQGTTVDTSGYQRVFSGGTANSTTLIGG